jgi:hypothetical protein
VNYLTGQITRLVGGRIMGTPRVTFQVFTASAGARVQTFTRNVGERIEPPAGSANSLVGYIRESRGTALRCRCLQNPFVVGFPEQEKGAIIGVNRARREERAGGLVVSPQSAARFQDHPDVVALLRSSGSPCDGRPLHPRSCSRATPDPAICRACKPQARSIVRTIPSKAGYNPNEEHALMLNRPRLGFAG